MTMSTLILKLQCIQFQFIGREMFVLLIDNLLIDVIKNENIGVLLSIIYIDYRQHGEKKYGLVGWWGLGGLEGYERIGQM